jgi:hypothetical protein
MCVLANQLASLMTAMQITVLNASGNGSVKMNITNTSFCDTETKVKTSMNDE